jgi:hypothetical protein
MKVPDVDSTGVATLLVRATHLRTTLNGNRVPAKASALGPGPRPRSKGRVVAASLSGLSAQEGANLAPGLNQISPLLPDRPVKAGTPGPETPTCRAGSARATGRCTSPSGPRWFATRRSTAFASR